ncbi:MAG: SOS response-associated peptidase [Anaerolineales bacterium]
MCGRFTLTADINALQGAFPWLNIPPEITPRYNIAPTQPVAVVPNDGKNRLDYFNWGLIPSWAKDPEIGSRMINARSETLAEKPAFRSAFRRRRCLVLADGFYEWQKQPGSKSKLPMYIRLTSMKPFAFAGLWEIWNSKDGSSILSCAIITTEPNELMKSIHNRMPVILPEDAYQGWLEPGEKNSDQLSALLAPYPADLMTASPVSTLVNNPRNDTPECVVPLA